MPKPSSVNTTVPPTDEGDIWNHSSTSPVTPPESGIVGSGSELLGQDDQNITSLPPLPRSPAAPAVPPRDPPRGFLSGYRNVKSRNRAQEPTLRHVPQSFSTNNLGSTSRTSLHPYSQSPGNSSASLSHSNLLETVPPDATQLVEPDPTIISKSAPPNEAEQNQSKSTKHLFHGFLSRSRSIRGEEEPRTKSRLRPPRALDTKTSNKPIPESHRVKTAPLDNDRSFREMMSSSLRNRSADRHAIESDDEQGGKQSSSYQSNSGANFFSNIVTSSSKAADGLGKAGKGFFGKLTRAGSSHERDIPDDSYVCRIINLPLIEQTRRTRVKARMEDAGDKTEFWMPALPYRCIDYLNLHGIEEEGLYRIPGSGIQVKHWQRRFDTELDINLLNERELYDINIIGSLFKAWLRELPDELLPKATQSLIAKECIGAKETPQLMKDELSKLPPFNYYLLFAITCHISLLHEHSDKNKMNYHNLCICFQPCMKIDGFCFQFLVQDWRNCWQGCWTEKQFREEEERYLTKTTDPPSTSQSLGDPPSIGEDTVSPPTSAEGFTSPQKQTLDKHQLPPLNTALAEGLEKEGLVPRTTTSTSHSTPPTLTPVQTVSPMRM